MIHIFMLIVFGVVSIILVANLLGFLSGRLLSKIISWRINSGRVRDDELIKLFLVYHSKQKNNMLLSVARWGLFYRAMIPLNKVPYDLYKHEMQKRKLLD